MATVQEMMDAAATTETAAKMSAGDTLKATSTPRTTKTGSGSN